MRLVKMFENVPQWEGMEGKICEKGEAGEKEWKCEKGKGEKDDKVEGVRRVN